MASHITVKNLSHLYALQNHEDGELAYVEDIKKIYSWQPDDGWQEVNIENKGLELNLYELNKNAISQLAPLTPEEVKEKLSAVKELYETTKNNHYMLLSWDNHYFTIFQQIKNSEMTFEDTVHEIIAELGPIYCIEACEGGVEFWIKTNDEPVIFILFPYDGGVVYYE